MDKATVFPITHDFLSLINYIELVRDYQIIAVNSFKEDGLLYNIKKEYPNWVVTSNVKKSLEGSGTLILFDNEKRYKIDKYQEMIAEAKIRRINILASDSLKKELKCKSIESLDKRMEENKENEEWEKIPVPAISVLGLGENCSKFESLLLLMSVVEKRGYKSLTIASNPLISLCGGYVWPEYLYQNNISLEKKIYKLNYDLGELVRREKPEVLLVEIPGGIMPLGKNEKNHFSEVPLVISNALDIDAGILNMYVPFQKDMGQLDYIKDYCDYKYGIPIETYTVNH